MRFLKWVCWAGWLLLSSGAQMLAQPPLIDERLASTQGCQGINLEQAGYKDLAIAQLERAYAVAPNDATRNAILKRLERLQAQSTLDRIRRGMAEFFDRWQREAPFFDEGTFVLCGARRDPYACVGLVGDEPSCAPGWAGSGPLTSKGE